MSDSDFFESFCIHTEVKLKLYGDYLQRYLMILLRVGSIHSIHIYDLFCGKGETDEGQTGSALIGVQHVLSSVTELAVDGS